MSEWDSWFRGFMIGWFSALIEGLSSVEEESRTQILEKLQTIKAPSSKLADFEEAWRRIETPEKAKKLISRSLDAIPEIESEVGTYFREWCGTLMKGIEKEREDVRRTLLASCGQTCNEAHAQSLFLESWKESDDMASFIKSLNSRMGGDHDIYELIDDRTVIAAYANCYCPIVGFEFIASPMICNCSSSWLEAGFKAATGKSIEVEREETVMTGGEQCRFKVTLVG